MRATFVLFAAALAISACATPVQGPSGADAPVAAQGLANPGLSADAIVAAAHAAAGGETWIRPRTVHMWGEATFYRDGGAPEFHERYEMWRVYPDAKPDAHQADGRVRIETRHNGDVGVLMAFDGQRSYSAQGLLPPSEADRQWSESFGFGVIRFARDEGYALARLPDDLVDGRPVYVVRVSDPAGGETLFAIAQDDSAILRVGFQTPRGWHERIYSDFFSLPGVAWVQPGRVRLYYNGVKQNEVIWRDFRVNVDMPDELFVIAGPASP